MIIVPYTIEVKTLRKLIVKLEGRHIFNIKLLLFRLPKIGKFSTDLYVDRASFYSSHSK